VEVGSIGGGTGATVGKVLGMNNCDKGGVGYCELSVGGAKIGAVVVVNALGDVIDIHDNCKVLSGAKAGGEYINTSKYILQNAIQNFSKGTNTTIGCIFTDAKITREQANKLAGLAQNGLALSISPVHTLMDGDTMFVLANGQKEVDFNLLSVAVTEVVRQAVISAVKK